MKKGVQITLLSGQIIDDYPTAIVVQRRLLWSIDQTAMFVLVTHGLTSQGNLEHYTADQYT